jgi:hypothetical protein
LIPDGQGICSERSGEKPSRPWWSSRKGSHWEPIEDYPAASCGECARYCGSLIDFVASRIARYKKPKFVDFIDSLPKTEGGKIDREQVKKDFMVIDTASSL